MLNSRQSIFLVFDTDTPPDVSLSGVITKGGLQHSLKAIRALGQDLKDVPISLQHDFSDFLNVRIRHTLVEQIAHGIYEDHAGSGPAKGLGEFFRYKSQVETALIRMSWYSPKSLRENFCVAILAAGTDLGA